MNKQAETREMVCIVCPVGCRLTVTSEGDTVSVSGNRCPRGEVYGKEELLAPKRVITATCTIRSHAHPRLPVKTDAPLPFEHIEELIEEIYRLEIQPPVRRGQILIENYKSTGVNVCASRSIEI